MTVERQRVDPLRERLAAPELESAADAYDAGGVEALIDHAVRALDDATAASSRFDELARALAAKEVDRRALIAAYLEETVKDERALRDDLRSLRRAERNVLELDALGDRLRRFEAVCERRAEAALALAQASFEAEEAWAADEGPELDDAWIAQVPKLITLARRDGRWSRRVEALGMLERLAPCASSEERARLGEVAAALFRGESRAWVRVGALALWGAVDASAALEAARAHLLQRAPADDFLFRERIVELASRGGLGVEGFSAVADLAAADPSEHVRITLARAERKSDRLSRLAREDASPRVRASALLTLTMRDDAAAPSTLELALRQDPSDLVARIAAEELVELARHHRIKNASEVTEALRAAMHRDDLPIATRTSVLEACAAIEVLTEVTLRAAVERLAPIVDQTLVGGRVRVRDALVDELSDDQLGRVLSTIAHGDFALGVDRVSGGIMLHRGEPRGFAAWRALFEALHPSPVKRQAVLHTTGRRPRGTLRAPPGGLAELTATRVPGERVLVESIGEWGRHLPMPDDLLSATSARRAITVHAAAGTTRITPPPSVFERARAWVRLTLRYARFVDLRRRSLESDEPVVQGAYVASVARDLGIRVEWLNRESFVTPPRGLAPLPPPSTVRGSVAAAALPLWLAPIADRLGSPEELARRLFDYATSPTGNRLPQLAGAALLLVTAMFARSIGIRAQIDRARKSIPLVIGGWGTRGKSGTERLKTALFQGLGHETLVKTTGCEAMFIHAVPDAPAREIFIYRPYDKATVWEQRDVLLLARDLGVRVFLWECMALQPDLVNLLQAQWMRDDYSTITNAYPDHEDVQGPTGYDVATTIGEFVPTRGNLVTTERQMLPLLRVRAKERGTTLRAIPPHEAELLAEDLLARFPYHEHPSNIALVTGLARALGIPSAIAIAEMADNVVPDLGVLKTYASIAHRGRTLSFTNGMSANERTAALANWQRSRFDRHDVDVDPGRWIVTVVNNRADRVARSEVFARFLVEDIAAHRHVLIGTNVSGLLNYIDAALDAHLARIAPTAMLEDEGDRRSRVHARVTQAFRKLKIARTDAESVRGELASFGAATVEGALLEKLLTPEIGETLEEAQRAIDRDLPNFEQEIRPFVVFAVAKRRLVRAVHAIVDRDLDRSPAALDEAFARTYREIFRASLLPVHDARASGDRILDLVARSVPPGARATIMGVQNIKGTGLDFVYRWVSIERVQRMVRELESSSKEAREGALRALLLHGDYGLLDARAALEAVEKAAMRDASGDALGYAPVVARLRAVVDACERRLATTNVRSWRERLREAVGITLDYLDSTRRRWMARSLLVHLVAGRVSHAFAATRMREIIARSFGGWMRL